MGETPCHIGSPRFMNIPGHCWEKKELPPNRILPSSSSGLGWICNKCEVTAQFNSKPWPFEVKPPDNQLVRILVLDDNNHVVERNITCDEWIIRQIIES